MYQYLGYFINIRCSQGRTQTKILGGGGAQKSRTKLNIFGHYKNAQEHCAEGAKILKFSLLKTKKLVIPGINDSEMMVKVQ